MLADSDAPTEADVDTESDALANSDAETEADVLAEDDALSL